MLLIKLSNACVTVSLRVAIFNLQRINLGKIDNLIHEHDDIYIKYNIIRFGTINLHSMAKIASMMVSCLRWDSGQCGCGWWYSPDPLTSHCMTKQLKERGLLMNVSSVIS